MTMITDATELAELCDRLAGEDFLCIDTEFMRERTYWPHLCLVQIAGPDGVGIAIDPLADGLDLAPLNRLFDNRSVLKVFHAARQDLEIFYHMTGRVPAPLFDTQVAGMVCGFGEQASYETLAHKLAKARIDKSSRFSDWSKRPLNRRQLTYALADVAHLPTIYTKLAARLAATERGCWVEQELAALTDPETYNLDPVLAWKRIKTRNVNPRFLALLREIAAVRERWAQAKDIPRQRLLRDEALLEIAAHRPETPGVLADTRGLSKGTATGRLGAALLEAVSNGMAIPDAECPQRKAVAHRRAGTGPLVDLLKVLLKMRSSEHGVAQRLVATSDHLERIAAGDTDVPALHGWRHQIFGADALALTDGRLGLAARAGKVTLLELPDSA
ncbi:MAG: ribonuclease D [Alphaproteobacteria bacterium]|jgi:ribonuclease D|nr:ribonuclease D [Alphaproteobacteria bacterium]MDP6517141.1 ribonuclease D [Alphaproteobacteria bacterium]